MFSQIEKTPKEKRKLLTQKRQSLIGLAKKKAVGQMLMAKNKDSPVKQIKRRNVFYYFRNQSTLCLLIKFSLLLALNCALAE